MVTLVGRDKAPLPKRPPPGTWPTLVNHDRAVLELGWKGAPGRLKRALDEVGLEDLPLGRPVTRKFWEMRYPLLVRKLEMGTPIVPLDGITVLDMPGADGVKVTVSTFNGEKKVGSDKFMKGD